MIARRKICGADTPLGRLAGFAGTLPATPLATLSLRVMVANDMELSFPSMAGAKAAVIDVPIRQPFPNC